MRDGIYRRASGFASQFRVAGGICRGLAGAVLVLNALPPAIGYRTHSGTPRVAGGMDCRAMAEAALLEREVAGWTH